MGGTVVGGTAGCAGCSMSAQPMMQGTPANGSTINPTPANNAVQPAAEEKGESVSPPTPDVTNKEET